MGATLDETRVELAAQRARVRATADRLEATTRRAFDLRAKVRENPAQTVAVAVAIAFILAGGPRRTVRQIRRGMRGSGDGERAYDALPGSLRAFVDASAPGWGTDRAEARRQLALALHAWREDPKNRKRAERLVSETLTPPGPGRAFWALVEVAAVTAAGILVRRALAPRLTEGLPSSRPPPAGTTSAETRAPTRYSGWSGLRSTSAGPVREPARPTAEPSKPDAGPS